MAKREIVFDTETTGLSPGQGHRMVELAAIEIIDGKPTGRSFHGFFNPERHVPSEVVAIHGLDDKFLADKPLFAARADEFLAFIGDAPLIAHNAPFDFGFVNAELARIGRPPLKNAMIDTKAMAKARFPGAPARLDDLLDRFGIDRSERIAKGHGALRDCELLAQVYDRLNAAPPAPKPAGKPKPAGPKP